MAKKKIWVSDRTLTRRSLVQWLGTGCVLALKGDVLYSCFGDLGPKANTNIDTLDAGQSDAKETGPETMKSSGFSFEPGELVHSVYDGWGERTVDSQDLKQILSQWKLTVDGLVEQSRVYTFSDLVALRRTDMTTDFHCVEGWSVYDVPWNGVHLSVIFGQVKPLESVTHVTFHTIGGKYNESLPLEVALESKTLLAYGISGSTLPLKHGFPLRIVVPRLLAYKNAKYIERIELEDKPVEGYWVKSGYPYDAEVPKSRLRSGKY